MSEVRAQADMFPLLELVLMRTRVLLPQSAEAGMREPGCLLFGLDGSGCNLSEL